VLQFHLYPLAEGDPPTLRLDEKGEPVRWPPFSTTSLFATIGRNTGYIIHPDEILADNAGLLAYPRRDPPSPELLARLAELLGAGKTEPTEKRAEPAGAGR
jgi:hypothetical protein